MRTIVSLKDTATQVYGSPFVVHLPAEAVRSLRTEVNSKEKSAIALYADDYELYSIGEFDELSGKIVPLDVPSLICRAKDLREPSAS